MPRSPVAMYDHVSMMAFLCGLGPNLAYAFAAIALEELRPLAGGNINDSSSFVFYKRRRTNHHDTCSPPQSPIVNPIPIQESAMLSSESLKFTDTLMSGDDNIERTVPFSLRCSGDTALLNLSSGEQTVEPSTVRLSSIDLNVESTVGGEEDADTFVTQELVVDNVYSGAVFQPRRPLTRRRSGAMAKARNRTPLTGVGSVNNLVTIDDVTVDNVTAEAEAAVEVIREKQQVEVAVEERSAETMEVESDPCSINYNAIKLKTRLTSAPLCDLIDALSVEQRLAICEMGFGGFLKVCSKKLPKFLPSWLIQHFDTKSCSVKFIDMRDGSKKELFITEDDVHLCIGLPRGGKKVILPDSEFDNFEGFYDFVLDWKRQYRNVLPVTTLMSKHFMEQIDGGDDFKRNFIVFIVSCFFLGDSSVNYKVKALKTCVNVDEVSGFNWCEFVLHRLAESVAVWKKNPKSMFTGPFFLLLMIFIDRVSLSGMERLVPRRFPTVSGWTLDKLNKYVKFVQCRGGIGGVSIFDRFDKSVDWMPSAEYYKSLIAARQEDGGARAGSSCVGKTAGNNNVEISGLKSWIEEVKTSSENVAVSLERFYAVLERGFGFVGTSDVVLKLRALTSTLFNSFLNSDATQPTAENSNIEKESVGSDKFFSDPSVVAAMCYLVDAADRMIARQNRDSNVPDFRLLSTQDEETTFAAEYNLDIEFVEGRVQSLGLNALLNWTTR